MTNYEYDIEYWFRYEYCFFHLDYVKISELMTAIVCYQWIIINQLFHLIQKHL